MLIAILKGISAILGAGLVSPNKEGVPRPYVENAKSMLDSIIEEYSKKPEALPLPPQAHAEVPPEVGLDEGAQAARNDLLVD